MNRVGRASDVNLTTRLRHDEPVPIDEEVNRSRVRAGLAIVTVTFLVAAGILLFVDDPLARVVMGLVMVLSLVRAALLVRSLRR